MSSLKIALVHEAVIPPLRYGGTERVILWLARGLHALGHQVTLIAAPGSRNPYGPLITVRAGEDWRQRVPNSIDLLHLWSTPSRVPEKPFLITIEGMGKVGEKFHPHTLFVSQKHAALHRSQHFVYNGLDPADYPFSPDKEAFAIFLAKASWDVKNLEGALNIARQAGVPLKVMGNRPLLKWKNFFSRHEVEYLGMVDDSEKRKILPRARALLFPVRWHEPFGMALTESLASGCCVLGTPYGSLPEIVNEEVGYLSTSAQTLAEKLRDCVRRPDLYSPQSCRERVLRGPFTHLKMAESYLRYYQRLLDLGHIGSSSEDASPLQQSPEGICDLSELLTWA